MTNFTFLLNVFRFLDFLNGLDLQIGSFPGISLPLFVFLARLLANSLPILILSDWNWLFDAFTAPHWHKSSAKIACKDIANSQFCVCKLLLIRYLVYEFFKDLPTHFLGHRLLYTDVIFWAFRLFILSEQSFLLRRTIQADDRIIHCIKISLVIPHTLLRGYFWAN